MDFDFADILMDVVSRSASDLHITAGAPPTSASAAGWSASMGTPS